MSLPPRIAKRKRPLRPGGKDAKPRSAIVYGESFRIAGITTTRMARDAAHPSKPITFDGATPPTTRKGTP